MNTLSGVAEPYATLTLDGLDATSTLIEDAVGDYLPLTGGTLVSSTGTTRLGIAASTLGTLEYFTTAGVSQASMFYNIGTSELRFNVGTATNILRMGSSTITFARNISMANTNRITNLSAGTGTNDAISYTQAMLRNGANAATADIPMGGFKLTGLAYGVAGTDAATVAQLTASPYFYLPLAGGTMSGNIAMGGFFVTDLPTPSADNDAARKKYVDDQDALKLNLTGGTLTGGFTVNTGAVDNLVRVASSNSSAIYFTDLSLTMKAAVLYFEPTNVLDFKLGSTLLQTHSTTHCTFYFPIAMSSKNITGLAAGAAGSTEAANVVQMEAADLVVTNAFVAADALKLSLTGGLMTGTITSNSSTPFNFENANAPVTARMSAGNVSVTNACTLQMNSNSASILDFRDNANATKAQFKYLYGSPGSLSMLVNAVTALSTTDTLCTLGVPVAMSSKKITGLLAGAATTTDAANVAQMEAADLVVTNAYIAADNLRVRHDGSTAMTGSLNMNSNSVNNVVNVRSPTATDLVLGRTGTGTEIQIKATEILIGKDITMSGGNLNMGTGYIGIQAGVQPTDAVNKGQLDGAGTALTTAYIAADAVVTNNSVQKAGSIMTGTLTINNIQTFLQATHTAASSVMTMQGGSSSVPNAAHIRMTMGTLGGLEFWDYSGVKMGYMQYDVQNTPDRIVFNVTGVSSLILQAAAVICSQPLAMSTKQITGLQTGSATDHAVNKGQMDTADDLRLRHDGTVAMTGQLYMGNFRIGNLSPGLTNLDAVNYQQIAQSSIPITSWRVGETISRYFMSPALGDNLVTNPSHVTAGDNILLIDTGLFYATAIGNRLLFKFGCECNAAGSGTDNFDIVLELGPTPTIQTFRYVLGPSNGYRNRNLFFETMYIAENVGSVAVAVRIYNYGNDTITTRQDNFHFSAEEIKA
jgi:hypothetical protein